MASHMKVIWSEARASLQLNQGVPGPTKEYGVGELVWLSLTNVATKRLSKKLDNKKAGPFEIVEKVSTHAYRLHLPPTMKIHNVFHINLLHQHEKDEEFERRQPRPPPVITKEGEEYKVDHIVAWEWRGPRLYYQVRWEGYDPIEDTMEDASQFLGKDDLLHDLRQRLPDVPMPPGDESPRNDLRRRTKRTK